MMKDTGIKILPLSQMLQRLPISLAQINVCNDMHGLKKT